MENSIGAQPSNALGFVHLPAGGPCFWDCGYRRVIPVLWYYYEFNCDPDLCSRGVNDINIIDYGIRRGQAAALADIFDDNRFGFIMRFNDVFVVLHIYTARFVLSRRIFGGYVRYGPI